MPPLLRIVPIPELLLLQYYYHCCSFCCIWTTINTNTIYDTASTTAITNAIAQYLWKRSQEVDIPVKLAFWLFRSLSCRHFVVEDKQWCVCYCYGLRWALRSMAEVFNQKTRTITDESFLSEPGTNGKLRDFVFCFLPEDENNYWREFYIRTVDKYMADVFYHKTKTSDRRFLAEDEVKWQMFPTRRRRNVTEAFYHNTWT